MDDNAIPVKVFCYAGYRSEETPQRFILWEKELEVREIIDQWHAPDHRYFKLIAEDGATYILRHDELEQTWELSMYKK